jgi:vacuolar protein sorting-associated protein 13A/C
MRYSELSLSVCHTVQALAILTKHVLALTKIAIYSQALRDLNLPITVKEGYLGHLSVEIPWRDLYNKSTEVVIEDVFLLVNPKENLFDEDFEKRLQVTKERFLQLRELLVTAPEDLAKQKAAQETQSTWTQRLTNTVINNLQLTVRRIHIRYEDGLSNPGVRCRLF